MRMGKYTPPVLFLFLSLYVGEYAMATGGVWWVEVASPIYRPHEPSSVFFVLPTFFLTRQGGVRQDSR